MNEKEINFENVALGRITPKNDRVFKRLFGNVGSEEILRDFLESILEIKIKKVNLGLPTELPAENYEGKESRLDVRADLDDRHSSKCRNTSRHDKI